MNTDKILAEAIAKDYAPKDNSKIVALKKLDKKAKLPATIFTYTFGVISALIVGTGMCLAMQVIGSGVVPMVAGIVCLMLNKFPHLSPNQIKAILSKTCKKITNNKNNDGFGYINLKGLNIW